VVLNNKDGSIASARGLIKPGNPYHNLSSDAGTKLATSGNLPLWHGSKASSSLSNQITIGQCKAFYINKISTKGSDDEESVVASSVVDGTTLDFEETKQGEKMCSKSILVPR